MLNSPEHFFLSIFELFVRLCFWEILQNLLAIIFIRCFNAFMTSLSNAYFSPNISERLDTRKSLHCRVGMQLSCSNVCHQRIWDKTFFFKGFQSSASNFSTFQCDHCERYVLKMTHANVRMHGDNRQLQSKPVANGFSSEINLQQRTFNLQNRLLFPNCTAFPSFHLTYSAFQSDLTEIISQLLSNRFRPRKIYVFLNHQVHRASLFCRIGTQVIWTQMIVNQL